MVETSYNAIFLYSYKAPSAVTASAVGGSANRSVVGRVSPTTSAASNAAQSLAPRRAPNSTPHSTLHFRPGGIYTMGGSSTTHCLAPARAGARLWPAGSCSVRP